MINEKDNSINRQPFIRTNRKNSLVIIDDEALINLKISLYTTLASIEEEIIGRNINKLFDRLIPNCDDQFKVNINLCKKFYDKNYSSDKTEMKLSGDVKSSLDSIINKNYNMVFHFFQTYVDELSRVLVYSYIQLGNILSHTRGGLYKISKYLDFRKAIDSILNKNIDVIKRYRDRENREAKGSIYSNSTRSSFSSGNTFRYTHSNPHEFEIPTEMILLINKFQTIKKLKLFAPNCVDDLLPFLIILMNTEWLFPNLFEIELDISFVGLHKELYDSFIFSRKKSKIKRKITLGNTNNYNDIDLKTRTSLIGPLDYLQTIKCFKNNFELIIVYSYFASKMDKIKVLSLIFPESFKNETEETLKLSDVYTVNFQFLNFFTPITNLYQLNINFNSLDILSFEKVISIFHKNNNLKKFSISFFGSEEHYTNSALLKLCSVLNININTITSKDNNHEVEDSNNLLLTRLLDSFEENLEKFFFIFQTKLNLQEYILIADLPTVISSNENFINTFHKFIFNHFILLNNEELSIQTLKINMPNLSFDNRKYPSLSKFFDTIDLRNKQRKLSNISISLQFNKLSNIANILTTSLKFLNLGDFDLDSLNHFLKFFSDKEFREKSQLTCLEISLSSLIFDFKLIQQELINFLVNNYPRNLKEFSLFSHLILNIDNFDTLFNLINNDRIEKYCFEFNKKSIQTINFPTELRYRVENKKLNKKIIFNALLPSKKLLDYKIFSKIQRFLEIYEKKVINIKFK